MCFQHYGVIVTSSTGQPKGLGDLAEKQAAQLDADTSAPVAEAATLTEEAVLEAEHRLFTKIRFSWRPEDRAILDRIRIAADAMFEEAFADAITTIDEFYMQLRVPEQREVGGLMMPVLGADQRPVWKKDDQGRPVEQWNQITGQDVEHTLARLEYLKFTIAPRVNELFLEALMARHVASDTYDDAWSGVMEGTQGDRTARSNRESRVDRYHAYFRYYVYSVAKTFLTEIDAFIRLLRDIRFWQVQSQKG